MRWIRFAVAVAIGSALLTETQTASVSAQEPPARRPLFHFTPEKNFINDPNGCLYLHGQYHLFYQHNPEGDRWGHMSWGHAVSKDLVRWEHQPLALREEDGIMIFSGSAVFDAENTSGLGTNAEPPVVAVYTGDGKGKQTQNLAASGDGGRTWKKYAKNPVSDIGSNSYRDPKVFWHRPTSRWIMATVLADDRRVRIWGSENLKDWKQLSEFGPAGSTQGVWECPELLEVPIDEPERPAKPGDYETAWVLKVDVNAGAPFGGSGGQYFVGKFNGTTFTPEHSEPGSEPNREPLWIDFGKDFYAAQAFNNAPATGQPVWIAWMNNWQYANDIPTAPWRGAMTLPRSLSLRKTPAGLRLVQAPVTGLESLRGPAKTIAERDVPVEGVSLAEAGVKGQTLEIVAKFAPGASEQCGLKVREGNGEETLVGLDFRAGTVFVDRTRSGDVSFSKDFAGRHAAKLEVDPNNQLYKLHVIVDATSVEVFADGGRVVLTDQIFPRPDSQGVSLFATHGSAKLVSLQAWELKPTAEKSSDAKP
ncbi:MAG TPA: glycoside hydrolase family 32 protein [Pirellulales bacterium]